MSDSSNTAKSIFLAAIEGHAPEQWPAFLDEACGADPALRNRVEQLLRARSAMGLGPTADQVAVRATTIREAIAFGPADRIVVRCDSGLETERSRDPG